MLGHRDLKIKLVFNKLRVPVGDVDCVKERHPFLIAGHTKRFLHKRGPLRLHWPADERHAGLMGRPAALAPIAFMTGADDIFPDRCTPLRAWNNVIQVELMPWQSAPTVLAGTFIPSINIVSAEPDLALGHSIVGDQQDHSRNSHNTID